ncbi:hypothetical protein KDA_13510 [Dictyobacter alpinus]|uniref:Uncharacterized protein n=1 Tax=Dictyobacter alpinus TaxID=2014873 RepID=A0A402B3H8_9CHLR|nr:hypothetical protein [Dictyobacter alpinus]GCE25867.1 hypothetical protein KDA_13510 [Dictyobacter alpinus]
MDAEEILAQANTGAKLPEGWTTFPLLKGKVIWGIIGWIFGVVMGLGLLVLIVPIVIPFNYQRGTFSIVLTTLLLAVLAFILVGSICMGIIDILRLSQSRRHMIVLTRTDFLKADGAKITQVPLANIRHVTPRGRAPIDRNPSSDEANISNMQGTSENVMGFIFGRGVTESGQKQRRKRVRTPTSLAFIDDRTDTEVTVVNDNAFGDPFTIAAVLKQYVASARAQTQASVQK